MILIKYTFKNMHKRAQLIIHETHGNGFLRGINRSSHPEEFLGKRKANLQQNTHVRCDFNKVAKEIY